MALAVTVVSFSLAGNDNKEGYLTDDAALVTATADTNTNIDNIIENSYNVRENGDHIYRVVEITSGSPSSLKAMVEDGDFESYVVNGNATKDSYTIKDAEGKDKIIDAIMNPEIDAISYEHYTAAEVLAAAKKEDKTDYNNILAVVSKADFIYLYNDTASPFGKGNDLDEELYNILHTYAVGDYKPLVISDISNSGGNGGVDDSTTNITTTKLANDMFEVYGRYYYTFNWKDKQELSTFFAHQDGSMYLTMNGKKKSVNWSDVGTDIASPTDSTEQGTTPQSAKKMAEMLIITNGTTTPMADEVMGDFGNPVTGLKYVTGTDVEGDVYDIKTNNALIYQSGYNSKSNNVRPDYMKVTEIQLADISKHSLDKYDMVIIEANCAGAAISSDDYNQLAAAMYGNIHMVYSSVMTTVTASGPASGGSVDVGDQQATNFSEIFYMVATTTGQEKYENIMVTNRTEFDIIAGSKSSSTAKVIADLINASAFRGIGGPKSSSSKFTVLEIQPCYPIDEALAAKNKNYYTIPSDVVNGQTKEELLDGTEYYAWELSKAKIAAAFNLTTDQITLVQMSSEQFASTKEDVFGTYDLIYIGGNTSALKKAGDYGAYGLIAKNSASLTLNNLLKNPNDLSKMPIYVMYSHSGELIQTDLNALAQASGTVVGDVPSAYVDIDGDGTKEASFTLLNGNDITLTKLTQLQEYVDKGMPVVFSKEASEAYSAVKELKYNQNSIDPDSNMCKFMAYCGSSNKSNVLWNFDQTQVQSVENNGGDYGDTLTGFVTVFADAQAGELNDLYNNNVKRPKVTLTEMPATYNMYDDSSIITNKTMSFKYKVAGATNYTVKLYVDDNGNSVFEGSEVVATGDKNKLDFVASDNFYGPVYWKLVVANPTGLEASTTGISYIGNTASSKQKVKILQIMPGTYNGAGKRNADAGETAQGKNSLYFCTICQQAYERLEFNPSSESGGRTSYVALYDGRMIDHENGLSYQGNAGKIYLGVHEHEFGIVKYDSTMEVSEKNIVGADNWDLNLADEVRDKYDFDIEIMMRSEFVQMSTDVANAYDFSKLSDTEKATLTANNPYEEKTEEYDAYAKAEPEAKLKMVYDVNYETLRDEALDEYKELTSLIYYTEDDFNAAFVDYQYIDEYKLELNTLTEAQKAEASYTKSTIDAEIDLRNALIHMRDELGVDSFHGKEIDRLLVTRHYWDYYSIDNGKYTNKENWYITKDGENLNALYQEYVKLKDKEILANNQYKKYSRYLSGSEWLLDKDTGFDMIVIGAADDFSNDDFILTKSEGEFSVKHNSEIVTDTYIANSLKVTLSNFKDSKGNAVFVNNNQVIDAKYEFSIGKNVAGADIALYKNAKEPWNGFNVSNQPVKSEHKLSDKILDPYGNVSFSGVLYEPTAYEVWPNEYYFYIDYDYTKLVAMKDITMDVTIASDNNAINETFTVTTDASGKFNFDVDNYIITQREVTSVDITDVTASTVVTDKDGKPLPAARALADLEDYMKNDGQVLMFHDTLTRFDDAGSVYLTNMIKKYAAMDRYNMEIDKSKTDNLTASYYVPYKSTDPEKYFMTDISIANSPSQGSAKYMNWLSETNALLSEGLPGLYLSDVAYTDTSAVIQNTGGSHENAMPYIYADLEWSIAAIYARDDQTYLSGKASGAYGADKASRTNEGVVTLYPFTLADQLNVSFTHAQAYAVDIENDDVTVWYSMGGGTGDKKGSSVYAASPNDGMDSYFIYTYKNFNYCGAGHTNVTGCGKDNNDERRLYINIICNSVKKSIAQPDIYVYDYQTEENNIIKNVNGMYVTKVEEDCEYLDFSFLARLDEDAEIKKVQIYFDLDYIDDESDAYDDKDLENHILIADWTDKNVTKGTVRDVFRYDGDLNVEYQVDKDGKLVLDTNNKPIPVTEQYDIDGDGDLDTMNRTKLYLKDEYFNKYGGKYTYIVIAVYDTESSTPTYKRIKIERKEHLFNLT